MAIEALLEDPGFTIASPLAANALETAKLMKEWERCEENKPVFNEFALHLVGELFQLCSTGCRHPKAQREKLWGQYHMLRSSKGFRESWSSLLQCIQGCTPCPIFYQYVTDKVFKQVIRHNFPTCKQVQNTTQQVIDLTHEESSALRYAAGYICRAMRKEFKSSPEVLVAIDELIDESKGKGDNGSDNTNDWMKLMDRGGLIFVKDITYMAFQAIEMVVRKYFCRERVEKVSPSNKCALLKQINEDEDVSFYLCMLFANVDEGIATTLFDSIVKLYVTM